MSSTAGPSRFTSSVLLGGMLFAPAAFLVFRGNLSIHEALLRFGCALLFAMLGTALVLSATPVPGSARDTADQPGGAGDQPGSAAHVTEATTSISVPVTQPAG